MPCRHSPKRRRKPIVAISAGARLRRTMHRDEDLQRSAKSPAVPAWVFRALGAWVFACLFLVPLAAVIAYPRAARGDPFPIGDFAAWVVQLSVPVLALALAYYGYRERALRRSLQKAREAARQGP